MVDIVSLTWTQFLSLFDLGNPFSVFFWVMCLALLGRTVLVLFPLKELYNRWRNKDPKPPKRQSGFLFLMTKMVPYRATKARNSVIRFFKNRTSLDFGVGIRDQRKDFKEALSDESLRLLRNFILFEIIIALLPAIFLLSARVILGTPSVYPWPKFYLGILGIVYLAWFIYHVKRSFNLRAAFGPLQRFFADPYLVKTGLGATVWSRRNLNLIANAEVSEFSKYPETQFEPITKLNDSGKTRPDFSGMVNNVKEVKSLLTVAAKNTKTHLHHATKKSAGWGKQKIDSKIDDKTRGFVSDTNYISNKPGIVIAFHIFMNILPVLAIYGLNWSLKLF